MKGQIPTTSARVHTESGTRSSKSDHGEQFTALESMICVQARWLTIQAQLTVSVGPAASQVRSRLAWSWLRSTFDSSWQRGRELSPFLVDNKSAVDFLLVVVESPIGASAKHSAYVVTEAVALQVYKLLTNPELDKRNARASVCTAMSAVYVAPSSLHYNQRVPHPSKNTLMRMAVSVSRNGQVGRTGIGGKRTVGLIEDLRLCVCYVPNWALTLS
eukprot:6213061-Pleurochrysis_carterae.AAC.11